MFKKSEGIGDIVMTVPILSKPVDALPGETAPVMELVDPTQQMPFWIMNFSRLTVRVRLFADGVEKQSYTLGPHEDNARSLGSDGDCQINALIFANRPEFRSLGNNPMVVFFAGTESKVIRGEFTVVETGQTIPLEMSFRFAPPERAKSYLTVFSGGGDKG